MYVSLAGSNEIRIVNSMVANIGIESSGLSFIVDKGRNVFCATSF